MTPSVVVAGGGTGGHVYPGIALAEAIRVRRPDADIAFIGTSRGLESSAVPAAGFALETVDVLPWTRTIGVRRFWAPATALRAAAQARRILRRRGAHAVAVMGGYASLPAALAAHWLGLPLVVHEQNAIPGRANRVAARLTGHVFATFDISAAWFPKPRRVRVVGNPVRAAIARLDRDALRPQARQTFGLHPHAPTVLVFGGSRGARRLSDAARGLGAWAESSRAQILLLAGRGEAAAVRHARIVEVEYTERMDLAYAAADVVVARAGAGIMEIACAGLPAVLVPYPYARDDHQTANARVFDGAGAAVVVADADATSERIAAELDGIIADPDRAARMSAAARSIARPDAAGALADRLVALAESRR